MSLLNLPPEVFQRVVEHLVTDGGVARAWRQRDVSRTFRSCIEYEIFARQHIRAFLKKGDSGRQILKNNIVRYLSYRINSLKGAHAFLPNFLNDILDSACAGLPKDDYNARQRYALLLCDLLVENRSEVWSMLTAKVSVTSARFHKALLYFQNNPKRHEVAAAAAVGNLVALKYAVGGNPSSLWERSPVFGYPLILASSNGHYQIVKAIVKVFEKTQYERDIYYLHLEDAIEAALEGGHAEAALLLLQVFHQYASSVGAEKIKRWIPLALETGDRKVSHAVLALRRSEDLDLVVRAYRNACEEDDRDLARMLVAEDHLGLNRTYACINGSPLRDAVELSNLGLVKDLLDMGANPDCCFPRSLSRSPLWKAIDMGDIDMVQLLLESGANPEPILEKFEDFWQDYRDAGGQDDGDIHWRAALTQALDLLFKAKDEHNYFIHNNIPKVQFAADGVDL